MVRFLVCIQAPNLLNQRLIHALSIDRTAISHAYLAHLQKFKVYYCLFSTSVVPMALLKLKELVFGESSERTRGKQLFVDCFSCLLYVSSTITSIQLGNPSVPFTRDLTLIFSWPDLISTNGVVHPIHRQNQYSSRYE